VLAQTELMNFAIKYYYEGGENALHTHPTEDHDFIVLDGGATFYDKEGAAAVLTKGKGILLPKGWYDRCYNTGGRPLIILRFRADKDKAAVDQTGIDGQPIPSRSRENNFVEPQPIEGSFWSL
jgi:oxalate decarboxylase/phosphoglucose isomerase-like protein (cupin superfamily)